MQTFEEKIPTAFLSSAAAVLGDTNTGLTGSQIVDACNSYAVDWGVDIPHAVYPYEASSKRQALLENLLAFTPWQQFRIISDLCEHPSFPIGAQSRQKRSDLKLKLFKNHAAVRRLDEPEKELNVSLVEETTHWLDVCPPAQVLYLEAQAKYEHGVFQRNVLDDLRLCLEMVLKRVLGNQKSLENQLPSVGAFMEATGASKQLVNMLRTLLDYYAKYQNAFVKHNSAVKEEEIEIVFEMTSSFMKHLIRLAR